MPPQTRSSAQRTTRSSVRQKTGRAAAAQTTSAAQSSRSSKSTSAKAQTEKTKPPPRKRARRPSPDPEPEPVVVPPKRVRGKQGKLKGLMNMPVDIFAEIAVYLYPIDLVFLARANKFFRQMLMSRSFIHVWRCAEGNIEGLPSCPKGLCEPQYAALVFTKYCSMCGDQALRPMDPILQARLCVKCRDEQAVDIVKVTDSSLVFRSRDLVPGKHSWSQSWCLYNDARAIKDKLNTLEREGNQEETDRWKKERRLVVSERVKEAQPLIQYLRSIENRHDAEISGIRRQRETEIKSRLLRLGCEKADIEMYDRDWRREWKSVACIAKPLTERVWESILPSLLSWVERNREQRLESEKRQRRWQRQYKVIAWMDSIRLNMGAFAQALSINEASASGSNDAAAGPPLPVAKSELPDTRILKIAIPSSYQMILWPTFETMLDTDVSPQEFEQTLQRSKPTLDKLVLEWMKGIEQTLIGLLPKEPITSKGGRASRPDDDTATQVTSSIPKYTFTLGGSSEAQPLTKLPLGTQRLLRADCVFMNGNAPNFYPDDFHGSHLNEKNLTYNPSAVKVAKALLAPLGLLGATYLQLKAAGSAFICGRCNFSKCMTWKDIIRHYLDEENTYASAQKNPRVRSSSITYIFTHDVEVVNPSKPLLSVASAEAKAKGDGTYYGRHRQCLVCKSVGINCYHRQDMILGHIHDVHLVENPQENKHYR